MPATNGPTDGREPSRYEIHVRGPIGPTMSQAFPTLAVTRHGEDTVLVGSLPDHCALYGVIHELEALGLQLQEIRRLPRPSAPASSDSDRPEGTNRSGV
jgi:hypothetical protein